MKLHSEEQRSHCWWINIASELMALCRQANIDPDLWRQIVSLGGNELKIIHIETTVPYDLSYSISIYDFELPLVLQSNLSRI